MINISELHDDLLLKILSFLPTKDVVATSVLSKPWLYLWEQRKLLHDDVDIVVICPRCSPYGIVITCVLDPSRKYYTEGDEDPSSQRRLASLLTRLKADLCTDCYRRTLAAKKLITIFILEFGTPNRYQAFIWTKLEKKQQMEIESVCLRDTNLCYCLSLI